MGVVNGTNLRIYDSDVPLGYATSCSLSMSAETRETLSKDSVSSWAEFEVGQLSATLSFEGFYSSDTSINATTVRSIDEIYTKFEAKTSISWKFQSAATGEFIYSGTGYITSLEMSAPVEENATYSGTITVTGAVTNTTIT